MILVVDCGGSKYEAGLFSNEGSLEKSVKNDIETDIYHDQKFIPTITELAKNQKIDSLIFGLAGISRYTKDQITDIGIMLQSNLKLKKIIWLSDADLLGSMLSSNGLGISLGTGSALIYKTENDLKILGGLGYLFNDYLSGWWWFQKLFETSMNHFENRSEKNGFEEKFLNSIGADLTRKSLIAFSYSASRHDLAELGSRFLPEIYRSAWFSDQLQSGINGLLKNIENYKIHSVCFQGGILNSHPVIKYEMEKHLVSIYPHVKFKAIDSLLVGGYEYWKEKQVK